MAPIFTGRSFGFGRVDAPSGPSGPSIVPVNIYLWGGLGTPGRSGAPEGGGWTQITGTVYQGTTISYIVGYRQGGANFFYGGPGSSPSADYGGGFSAAFIGPAPSINSGNATTYVLGVAGGAGGGGNDGFGDARGGGGGGTTGNRGREVPDQGGLSGSGGTQSSGGGGGSGGGLSGSQWAGGGGGPQNCGGGGGGYYGGGGGGTNSSYDAAGGGGSGYVRPSSTLTNGVDSFTVISTVTNIGTTSGHTVPAPIASLYPSPNSANTTGKVVIEVNGIAVINSTTAPPGSSVNSFTIT